VVRQGNFRLSLPPLRWITDVESSQHRLSSGVACGVTAVESSLLKAVTGTRGRSPPTRCRVPGFALAGRLAGLLGVLVRLAALTGRATGVQAALGTPS
jgi:hypothetical protein